MIVLALDTTTRAGSCAVVRGGGILLEHSMYPGRSHDAQLPGALMALLRDAQVTLAGVDVFAVATGPGSFTGLRVGIAAMQGLAFAAGKPLVGVSAFDALARLAGGGEVATWIDAWRGEVYAARYRDGREVEPPSVEAPSTVLARVGSGPVTFIGEGAGSYRAAIETTLGNRARVADPAAPPLAATIAIMAAGTVDAGHRPPPHAIRPLYVRRPDAELARDARSLP